MTDEQHHLCGIFIRSLALLDVDDDGLTDDCHFDDMQAVAQACVEVKEFTAAGDSPEELLLHRVADLTENVLMTWAHPDRQAVKAWLIARGELLQLRLTV